MKLKALGLSAIGALLAVAVVVQPAMAAEHNVQCDQLPAAIASASAGDVINVEGECTLTSTTFVDKQLTIHGVDGATINTSGSAKILVFIVAGSTLDGFTVNKTDKVAQNIIGIQGANTTITNNEFSGQYTLASNDHTSRALEVSSTSGLVISDNTFNNLRQPAYINSATGTITNNYVNETRGFVIVSDSNLDFSGNTWGANLVDIAIVDGDGNPATPAVNNYGCEVVRQIIAANNDAVVENQVQTPACPVSPVSVDECKNRGWETLVNTEGVTFKNQGQCVAAVVSNENSKHNRE